MEDGQPGDHGVHVQSAVTQVKGQGHEAAPIQLLNMVVTAVVKLVLNLDYVVLYHAQV